MQDDTQKNQDDILEDNEERITDSAEQEEPVVKEIIKEVEVSAQGGSASGGEVEVNVDYKDKWLRAQADYSNLIKETAEKRSEWAAMSEWHILEEFIPVYDNFKLAYRLQSTDYSPEQQKWVDGIGYIMKQFGDILKQHGIEEIETVGAAFDPTKHEVLSEESSDEHDDGAIIREVNAGYKKGERVLKVAGVVLNKK